MSQPDFERAREYVLMRLEQELPPNLFYHGIHHTRDDVLPAVARLAAMARLSKRQTLLLKTAALFHDIGFIEQYEMNEPVAIRIAAETLPSFGYTPKEIQNVQHIIAATQMPQTPNGPLENMMCDADLDSLGREDYFIISGNLRKEQESRGYVVSDRDWFENQLVFLSKHQYFSPQAHALRDAGKQKNIEAVLQRLKIGSEL